MSHGIPVGEFAPVIIGLLVLAIVFAMLAVETERRRRAAAASRNPEGPL